jgi:hypothetical protein
VPGVAVRVQVRAVRLAALLLTFVAAAALADDAPKSPAPPAAPVEFGTDLAAAQAKAKDGAKPLLVLVVPKW